MRRFEFVSGSSSKFWSATVEGTTFIVVFGRIGTAGQRKEKAFPSEADARRELDKKTAEKLREGYVEASAAAAAPAVAVPAAAAATPAEIPLPPLPPRLKPRARPAAERVRAATSALQELVAALQQRRRSWTVTRSLQEARRRLRAIAGYSPDQNQAFGAALDAVLATVTTPAPGRLSPRAALSLLMLLDAAAFPRALALWGAAAPQALPRQLELLGDAELALRLAALLLFRPDDGHGTEEPWRAGWRALAPHLRAYLERRGSDLRTYLDHAPAGDARVAARAARLAQIVQLDS